MPEEQHEKKFSRQETALRPGLWFSTTELALGGDLSVRHECGAPRIDFGFVLSGEFTARFDGLGCGRVEMKHRSGMGGIKFFGGCRTTVSIPADTQALVLHVYITPPLFRSLLQNELEIVPKGFLAALEGKTSEPFMRHGAVHLGVRECVHQALHGASRGMPHNIFLEGKALELIALQLSWLNARERGPGRTTHLSPRERKAIEAARDMLVADIASPPGLVELSRHVGLNLQKLQHGFQQQFGSTIYGLLKEYRLQRARQLFDQGDMNVSEVAWHIGYTNISHFSAAYKRRFGILPKQYLKSMHSGRPSSPPMRAACPC